jgi:hypothetical protein
MADRPCAVLARPDLVAGLLAGLAARADGAACAR